MFKMRMIKDRDMRGVEAEECNKEINMNMRHNEEKSYYSRTIVVSAKHDES